MAKGGPIRWTAEMLAEHQAKMGKPKPPEVAKEPQKAAATDKTGLDALYALGRMAKGRMNKTEQAYSELLAARKHDGSILWFKFEAVKLRLADSTFFTPDFIVLSQDGIVEFHEVKGFMLDDANVKLKVAASSFPFVFFLIRKAKGGTWTTKRILNDSSSM